MRTNKKIIVFILLISIPIGLYFVCFYFNFGKGGDQVVDDMNNDSASTLQRYTQELYVPVVNLKSYEKVISFDDLFERPLLVLDGSQDLVEQVFPEEIDLTIWEQGVDELSTYLSSTDDNSIAILPIDLLDVRFKVLQLDGVDVFADNFDVTTYPLTSYIVETIEKTEQTGTGDITISNWDPAEYDRFFAGGEIITGRGVDLMWLQRGQDNFEFLFDRIKEDISSADLALALMEHSYQGDPVPCPRCTSFVGDEKLIPQLKNVGFDLFSLAGNHIGDGGIPAEVRTRELLTENQMQFFGAGDNLREASDPAVVEVDGIRYAFLGADDIASFYWAGENSVGENRFSYSGVDGIDIDKEKVQADIANAKSIADKVIVYMSWGVEYTNYATDHQQELAHLLIDSGVDLVLASHPHWVQSMEIYNGKLIVYSMGNLIFDQTHTDPTREAVYLNLNFLNGDLVNVELVPILTCGYHFGANNLAYDVLAGKMTYAEVDAMNESSACVWLQPKPLGENHPKYKVILDRIYEYSEF